MAAAATDVKILVLWIKPPTGTNIFSTSLNHQPVLKIERLFRRLKIADKLLL